MKGDRGLGFAVLVSLVLFAASSLAAWFVLKDQVSGLVDKSFLLCITVPASAACAVALLAGMMRSLFDTHRWSVWHIVLLPPIHLVLIALIVSLATTSSDSIQAVNEVGKQLLIWLKWNTLLWAFICEVLFMSAALMIQRLRITRQAR